MEEEAEAEEEDVAECSPHLLWMACVCALLSASSSRMRTTHCSSSSRMRARRCARKAGKGETECRN